MTRRARLPPRPVLAISVGCPAGVGPEVAVAAAMRLSREARCVLVGDRAVLERAHPLGLVPVHDAAAHAHPRGLVPVRDAASAQALREKEIGWWEHSAPLAEIPPFGAPTDAAGAAQLAWIDQATDLVVSGAAAALVTGPVSKAAIASCGAPGAETFRGHTEHLAARLGAREVIMAFAGESLVTSLVTTHLAIADVPAALTKEGVSAAICRLAELLTALGRRRPRIAVASLNPHAGESGLLGREEIDVIAPGIELAEARLLAEGRAAEVVGPLGAETALRLAVRTKSRRRRAPFDGVVAMYHDQATIPSKLLGFGEAVNVTLGLPIVRTSVDHGTGYDIAGTGRADPRGMVEAIRVAVKLAKARSPRAVPY